MTIVIVPTISMQRGDTTVVQCLNCGCIATIPADRWRSRKRPIGPCPVCEHQRWSRQRMPVGGLRYSDEVES